MESMSKDAGSIRVCIGKDPGTDIAAKVLCHSIKQTLGPGRSVAFHFLTEDAGQHASRAKTGFSLQRWRIPELFDYRGRAIYLDADQLVFADIGELWEIGERHPHDDVSAWCVYRRTSIPATSVMLIDCEKARSQWPTMSAIRAWLNEDGIRDAALRYRKLMRGRLISTPPRAIDDAWNHLDHYVEGKTKLLHYTDLVQQPWRYPGHRFAHLWQAALIDALEAGEVSEAEIVTACARFDPQKTGPAAGQMHPHWLHVLGLSNSRPGRNVHAQ